MDHAQPRLERIGVLDGLRGLALLGILFANILSFEGWSFLSPEERIALAGQNVWLLDDLGQSMLIEGKFYTIFSLLFGIGIAVQMRAFARSDADPARALRRRMLVLFVIGFVHLLVLWPGDILALYGLVGLAAIACRNMADRRLLRWALALILLPIPLSLVVRLLGLPPDFGFYWLGGAVVALQGIDPNAPIDFLAILRSREIETRAAWQTSGVFFRIGDLLWQWRPLKVLGVMLLGLWVGRQLLAGRLPGDGVLLRSVALVGLLWGLPMNFAYTATDGLYAESLGGVMLAATTYALGVVPLGLGYAAAFALAWPRIAPYAGGLAAVGRMALTSYIGQTVICILIFYGTGLGLAGRVPPPAVYIVAFGIYLAQIGFARWWLAGHAQGPLEALWRQAAFGPRRALATP